MISCDVIQDLLPLYADGQLSNASKQLIEEHIQHCPVCQATVSAMCSPLELPHPSEDAEYIEALKKQKHKNRKRLFLACLLTVLFCVVSWWLYMETHFTLETPAVVSISEEKILQEMPQLALTQPEEDLAKELMHQSIVRNALETETVNVLSAEDAEAVASKILPAHAVLMEVAATSNTVYISYTLDEHSYTLGYMDPNHDGTVDAIEKTIGNGDFSGKGADTVYSLRYIPVLDLSQYEKQVLRHVWFGFLQIA